MLHEVYLSPTVGTCTRKFDRTVIGAICDVMVHSTESFLEIRLRAAYILYLQVGYKMTAVHILCASVNATVKSDNYWHTQVAVYDECCNK